MTLGIYVLLIAGPSYLWHVFKGRAEGPPVDVADTCLSKWHTASAFMPAAFSVPFVQLSTYQSTEVQT